MFTSASETLNDNYSFVPFGVLRFFLAEAEVFKKEQSDQKARAQLNIPPQRQAEPQRNVQPQRTNRDPRNYHHPNPHQGNYHNQRQGQAGTAAAPIVVEDRTVTQQIRDLGLCLSSLLNCSFCATSCSHFCALILNVNLQ